MSTILRTTAVAAVAALVVPVALDAQEAEEPQPGTLVVRYFQCPLHHQDEAVEMLNTDWRGYADAEIEAGNLIDYGILVHSWGDEWNVMDYFVAEDHASFRTAWSSMVQQAQAEDPDGEEFDRFSEMCPGHKDNIYSFVDPPDEMN